MSFIVQSIGSSSSGNAYLIAGGSTRILLDAGLSAKRIREGMAECGVRPEDVQAVLLTHEHIDHVRSIATVAKNCAEARIIASRGTVQSCDKFERVPKDRIELVEAQTEQRVGDFRIRTFALSHDAAEPIGFSISDGEEQVTVATDTGVITDEIYEEIRTADKLVLESNHEERILEMGPYPYSVKRRILSDHGHLSNVSTGIALAHVLEQRRSEGRNPQHILLAHLSSKNNTPEQALLTVRNILAENDFKAGRDYEMGVASRTASVPLL